MKVPYSSTVERFVTTPSNAIVASLTQKSQTVVAKDEPTRYTETWREKISILQESLTQVRSCTGWSEWMIALEYPVPWTVKHMDAVLIAEGLIFALELRMDQGEHSPDDVSLVEDFCLNLRDFHPLIKGCRLIPVLISDQAPATAAHHSLRENPVQQPFLANRDSLVQLIGYVAESYRNPLAETLDAAKWLEEPLKAVPNLSEAVQATFLGVHVDFNELWHENDHAWIAAGRLKQVIETAHTNREKVVCFLHGVPGSGKTLTALTLAGRWKAQLLSGNALFVKALQKEILQGEHAAEAPDAAADKWEVQGYLRELYQFFDAHYGADIVPESNIVFLDDAHRCRDRRVFPKKYVRRRTEPGMLLDIMDRKEWAVIVAIVGDGCLISASEAALPDWGEELEKNFSHWKVVAPPRLFGRGLDEKDEQLFQELPTTLTVDVDQSLQMNRWVRSPSTTAVAAFVDAVLGLRPDEAREIIQNDMKDYPFYLTRSLADARAWLTERRFGMQRCGLLASSGAKRLKAYGLDVPGNLNMEKWLMHSTHDVRSCCKLEIAARDRVMQGLELDWSGVCWGADLRHDSAGWLFARFHGNSWIIEDDAEDRDVILNRYRLLLTRAKEGGVIWVPEGDPDDATRQPEYYNFTAEYLASCGIEQL